ncbi:MAG: hypothetical protein Q8O34_05575 [Rhodocyclaceae bacterium]|nr:hypothetical protein [Rhodocyclaceae bacterium]
MRIDRLLVACIAAALPLAAAADDLVVVANPSSGVEKLTRDEVINIFLGRHRQLPSGIAAMPLDLPASSPDKALFYRKLVGKDLAEINAYWARLVFSGRTRPPRQTQNAEEMMSLVNDNRGAVGYVGRPDAGPRAKIVFELEQ